MRMPDLNEESTTTAAEESITAAELRCPFGRYTQDATSKKKKGLSGPTFLQASCKAVLLATLTKEIFKTNRARAAPFLLATSA